LVVAEGEIVWKDYIEQGSLGKTASVFFDDSVTKMDVARLWSLDKFMEGLPARSRTSKKKVVVSGMVAKPGVAAGATRLNASSFVGNNSNGGEGNQIDPRLRLSDLPAPKRAALFRYLHVTSSGIPGLIDMVSAMPPKYVRVKELLESVEVYFHVVDTILKRSTQNGRKAKRFGRVYDVGCGHGLVGMLIAASYPGIDVRSIDLVPRDSFLAQRDAFESTGIAMDNLSFETGDLSVVLGIEQRNNVAAAAANDDKDEEENDRDVQHTLMLCVHGCKELTHESIELARGRGWAWLAVPCCLQAGDHLQRTKSMRIPSDHTRYAMLCGAIAGKYGAESVTTIDPRITGRGIILACSTDHGD